ncbi:preprotein translocase subunit YajC [bacterium]|uniref:preprotein translocase subunit YajC n=1 Tax=uncultured Victivallis sp. TaxID=354118 RepID=UPI002596D681|nr:preprotein translocase subunit YajC [uncultured Victivallis sp.]MBS5529156.1 preprotein translocase subunit YajC [bacterium]
MSLNFILADAAPKTVSIGPGAPAQAGNAAVSNAVKATETVAVDPAAAAGQEQPPQQVPFFANPIILMLVVLGVMFFFTFRSQKKQQQKRQQMLDAIVKGTRVMLNNGIYGTVTEVKDKTYMVEIADKVVVEALKSGVAEVVGTAAPAEKK